jgi:hypothetical protein
MDYMALYPRRQNSSHQQSKFLIQTQMKANIKMGITETRCEAVD